MNVTRLTGRRVWDEEATVRVSSPVAGRVTAVDAVMGQKVEPGALLARISSPDFGQAQADVRKANADLILAERNLRRSRDLHSHGAAPQKDVEAAEDALAAAQADKERANARLALYAGSAEALVAQHVHDAWVFAVVSPRRRS
jgi:cobalt-zinc-cadmium efflux system membrane fusion protein